MHYHVISGARHSVGTPDNFKFQDRMEGIATFIQMAKVIWSDLEAPPAHEEIKYNQNLSAIRIQDEHHKLVFAWCDNNCDDANQLEFKLEF